MIYKRKSFIFSTIISLVIVYFTYNILQYVKSSNKEYHLKLKDFEDNLMIFSNLGRNLIERSLIDDLKTRLEEARFRKKIHFYILQKEGVALWCGNVGENCGPIDRDYGNFNKILHFERAVYSSIRIDDYTLTIGFNKSKSLNTMKILYDNKYRILKDLAWVFLMALILIVYFFKDFIYIINSLTYNKTRNFSALKGKTYEVDLFLKGLQGYEENIDILKKRAVALEHQVLPALRSAITSQKQPPFDFSCAMVLTDINNYSFIYNNYCKDEFVEIIKEFFHDAAHVISKYRGLIYKFVGDEAIFYFKDEDNYNSVGVAGACVVELNDLAESISQKYAGKVDYKLSIKSAISHGVVRLDSMINTYEIFGTSIIEGSRILMEILDKDKNSIFYTGYIKERLDFIFKSKLEKEVTLKGIKGRQKLFSFEEKLSVDLLLENKNCLNTNNFYYYRREFEILKILKFLKENSHSMERKLFLDFTKVMKHFIITCTSKKIIEEYKNFLTSLSWGYFENRDKKFLFFISSAIRLSMSLIPIISFDDELARMMKKLYDINNKRIIANIVDVFIYFRVKNIDLNFNTIEREKSSRIWANLIIKEGIEKLGSNIIRNISNMLRSSDPHYIAGALFSIGEIAKFYKDNNLVYFNTNLNFHKVISSIKNYITHENEMVRRQALIAAKKINDKEINLFIDSLYNSTRISNIQSSIKSYFIEEDERKIA